MQPVYPLFNAAVQAGNEVFNPRVEPALADRATSFYPDKFVWRATTNDEKEGQPDYVLTGIAT